MMNIYKKIHTMQQKIAETKIIKEGAKSFNVAPYFTESQMFSLWNKYNKYNLILVFESKADSINFIDKKEEYSEVATLSGAVTKKIRRFSGITGILKWKVIDGDVDGGLSFISGETPYGNINSSSNMSFGIESAKTYARRNVIGELLLVTVNGDNDPESNINVKNQINSGMLSKKGTVFANNNMVNNPILVNTPNPIKPIVMSNPIQAKPIIQTPTQPKVVEAFPPIKGFNERYINFVKSPEFLNLVRVENNANYLKKTMKVHGENLSSFPKEIKETILRWKN